MSEDAARHSVKNRGDVPEEGGFLLSMPGIGDEEESPLMDKQNRPRFQVLHHITVRAEPCVDGERTGDVLKKGTVFEGHDIVTSDPTGPSTRLVHWDRLPLSETCYVSLGEGHGWAISRNPFTEEPLLEACEDPLAGIAGVKQWMVSMFLGSTYDYIINVIIIINAIIIYIEISYHDSLSHRTIYGVNLIFSAIYLLEVVLKLFAFGVVRYFEVKWNVADFWITMITLCADVIPALYHLDLALENEIASAGSIAPVLRLLRLLRLAKIFKELAVLLQSFVHSIIGLIWIGMLMLLWFFICACVTTVFLGSKTWMPDGSIPEAKFLRDKFSTIPRSCFALLEVMTLEGWPDIVRPLIYHSPALMVFFLCFIFITAFVFLNLITAVVVEKMLAAQHHGQTLRSAAENDDWGMILNDLRCYLRKLSQGETRVHRSEMEAWLNDPGVISRLDILDWDKGLVLAAFTILDKNNSGYVHIDDITNLMSGAQRPLVAITLLRMQADLAQRMGKQDQILSDISLAKKQQRQQHQ